MTKEKTILYKKAYVEVYEMIKMLPDKEKERIPKYFIEYIYNNMDTNYIFNIDENKGLLEQDYMIETKALIVKLYEKHFSPESENEFWRRYNRICLNMIEEDKRQKYNPNDIFKTDTIQTIENNVENVNDKLPAEIKKRNLFQKTVEFVKKFLRNSKY